MQENNNQTEQTQPKTNNKNNLLIIIGIVVAVIIVILLIVFLVKPGNNGGTGGGGTNNPEVQKISLTGTKIVHDNILVKVDNTKSDTYVVVFEAVVYYNAKEVVNYTNQFISNFYAASAMLETVYIPKDENGELIKFDNHEVIITAYNHQK